MKRKLALDVDTLTVTSFDTSEAKALPGTVQAHDGEAPALVTNYPGCDPSGCNTRLTCSTNLC